MVTILPTLCSPIGAGFEEDNEQLRADAVRWMRGEFTTKTDARAALGVRTIVDDASVYDQLKLLARFVRLAGYSGLLVCLDELVNLYKLANTQARTSNYEQILRILNDSLQGSAEGLGFILGGTPRIPARYSAGSLQLSRIAVTAWAKHICKRRLGRFLGTGDTTGCADTGRFSHIARKASLRVCLGRFGQVPFTGRGDSGVHASLQSTSGRRLFSYTANHNHVIHRPVDNSGTESSGAMDQPHRWHRCSAGYGW